jgi:hypothetical protein
MDLTTFKSNDLGIHCPEHGQCQPFSTAGDLNAKRTSVNVKPRYFSVGKDVIEIKIQMSILRSVTAEDQSLNRDTARVRGSIWKGWYLKHPIESRKFRLSHLPGIAKAYEHVWELVGVDAEVISDSTLNEIDHQIRDLVYHSNKAPVPEVRTRGAVPSELSTNELEKSGGPSFSGFKIGDSEK